MNFFKGKDFRIRSKPNEFKDIYLDKSELAEIYNPKETIDKHGVFPDYAINNIKSKKTIYVEVKRQDGWVESGK
jgi:hypothetical protein